MMTDQQTDLTCDTWYNGTVTLWQPRHGFRATTDALLVAAAVDAESRHIAELGAGGGAASLALAKRCLANGHVGVRITAVERNKLMAGLLQRNVTENSMADQITAIEADITDKTAMSDLVGQFDHVFFNPPYNDEASSLSGDDQRKQSMAGDDLLGWIAAAETLLVKRGGITLISRSDRLDAILSGLTKCRFGDVSVRAVYTRADQPAPRVVVSARKGMKSPLTLLPPLVLYDLANTLTPDMDAISHKMGCIDMKPPGRNRRQPQLPQLPDHPA